MIKSVAVLDHFRMWISATGETANIAIDFFIYRRDRYLRGDIRGVPYLLLTVDLLNIELSRGAAANAAD